MNRPVTSDLPLEVIINIANAGLSGGRLRKETERDYIMKLRKINRHWGDALRSHPIFTTASMVITGNKLRSLQKWLAARQDLIIYSLECVVRDRAAYDALCTLLDNHFPHTTFNLLKIDFQFDGESPLHLPKSLRVHDLTLDRGESPDYYRDIEIDSGSFSQYLREHLKSLNTTSFTLSEGLYLKSLKRLTMHRSFIRYREPEDIRSRTYDNTYDDILSLLAINPHIKELSLGLSWPERIWHYGVGERLPRLALGQLDNLEKLHLFSLQVDFRKTQLPALKDLHIEQVYEPLMRWDGIGEQLESIFLQDCTRLYDEFQEFCDEEWMLMLDNDPVSLYVAKLLRDKPADADASPDDHDLLDAKKLGKFRHLRKLAIDEWYSSAFKEKFNAGFYDKSMPLLEEFHTHDHISFMSFRRFDDNHKHLTTYCDSLKDDIRYCGAARMFEHLIPELIQPFEQEQQEATDSSGTANFTQQQQQEVRDLLGLGNYTQEQQQEAIDLSGLTNFRQQQQAATDFSGVANFRQAEEEEEEEEEEGGEAMDFAEMAERVMSIARRAEENGTLTQEQQEALDSAEMATFAMSIATRNRSTLPGLADNSSDSDLVIISSGSESD